MGHRKYGDEFKRDVLAMSAEGVLSTNPTLGIFSSLDPFEGLIDRPCR